MARRLESVERWVELTEREANDMTTVASASRLAMMVRSASSVTRSRTCLSLQRGAPLFWVTPLPTHRVRIGNSIPPAPSLTYPAAYQAAEGDAGDAGPGVFQVEADQRGDQDAQQAAGEP